jgi:hypothetical protein
MASMPTLLLLSTAVSAVSAVSTAGCHFHVNAAGAGATTAVGAGRVAGSILEAQAAVRAVLARNATLDRDVVVCLGPGVHQAVAVSFDRRDSPSGGQGRVVWRGVGSKAEPAIVSGGVQVVGWRPTTLAGGPAFAAAVPLAARQLVAVRQLWVAGSRANRTALYTDVNCSICTTPNASKAVQCTWSYTPNATDPQHTCPASAPHCVGFVNNVKWGHCERCECRSENSLPVFTGWVQRTGRQVAVGYTASKPVPAAWIKAFKPRTIEFVWPLVIANWIEPRCTIESIQGNNLTLASSCAGGLMPQPVRIEAAPPTAALQPGEFFHDASSGTLYYRMAEGQSQADLESQAWIAREEAVVTFNGTAQHSWHNVQFSYSTWMQPNTPDGFVDMQAGVYHCTPGLAGCNMGSLGEPLASVQVIGGSDLIFSACKFTHIGSAYALSILGKNVTVTGSSFHDLSGGFLKLGSVGGKDNGSPDTALWNEHFTVTHNTASNQAIEFGAVPGYFGGFISHSTISHNTVSNAGYSGISQGWGWGGTHAPGYGNITISFNRIFNVMTKARDGGGIYVNGYCNDKYTNVISNNWVDHDVNVGAGLIYLDNGASFWHVTQNVVTNSPNTTAVFLTSGTGPAYNSAHNITVDHLWYQNDEKPASGCLRYGCVLDQATVFHIPIGQPLPQPAQAIMAAAGANPQIRPQDGQDE